MQYHFGTDSASQKSMSFIDATSQIKHFICTRGIHFINHGLGRSNGLKDSLSVCQSELPRKPRASQILPDYRADNYLLEI